MNVTVEDYKRAETFRPWNLDNLVLNSAVTPHYRNYDLANDPYLIHRRWDDFVRHLMGMDSPAAINLCEINEVYRESLISRNCSPH